MNDLEDIKLRVRGFSEARDCDQFHSPKNLTMAMIVEVGELMEHFQWLTEQQLACALGSYECTKELTGFVAEC